MRYFKHFGNACTNCVCFKKEGEKERERELIWSNVHFSILFVFVHNSSAVSVCENILNECVIYHIAEKEFGK